MSKTLSDLQASIDANTAAARAVAASFANASQQDFTPQVNEVDASTALLKGLLTPPAPAPVPFSASPTSVTLTAASPSQTVTLTPASGAAATFSASSQNAAVATVSPASGVGPFTIDRVAPGSTAISFTDAVGNVLNVPVISAA